MVIIVFIFLLILAGSVGFLFYNIKGLQADTLSSDRNLNQKLLNLEAVLASTTLTGQELAQNVADQRQTLEENINDIAGTVGTLEKLSKTDKELLQKYSKVYFLSDNYVPMSLDTIDGQYLYDQTKSLQFHASALPFLERMMSRAGRDNVSLEISSAYRSFGTQSSLKSSYLVTYGSGANQFSADQGYSEHQLGTAVDLTTSGLKPVLDISFDKTPAFDWLTKYAYRYGFILSYPKNNAYYQYEPWHWRFVGVELATRLHNDGINFSDMDQREIDKYLASIFD